MSARSIGAGSGAYVRGVAGSVTPMEPPKDEERLYMRARGLMGGEQLTRLADQMERQKMKPRTQAKIRRAVRFGITLDIAGVWDPDGNVVEVVVRDLPLESRGKP